MEFFTIGVYNSTDKEFFDKLLKNGIDTFCDIRQRRGVRGGKYSFVNSNRLQEKLKDKGIRYNYVPELAPSIEIRELQKKLDFENRESKTARTMLGKPFRNDYDNKILNKFNFNSFFESLKQIKADKIVLFCVEEYPNACHRSLVAERLSSNYNFKITHL